MNIYLFKVELTENSTAEMEEMKNQVLDFKVLFLTHTKAAKKQTKKCSDSHTKLDEKSHKQFMGDKN